MAGESKSAADIKASAVIVRLRAVLPTDRNAKTSGRRKSQWPYSVTTSESLKSGIVGAGTRTREAAADEVSATSRRQMVQVILIPRRGRADANRLNLAAPGCHFNCRRRE
jgi:hypothetical protein